MTSFGEVRASAVQAAPVVDDLAATVDKTCALLDQAHDEGANLVVFPETWLPGYPWWTWLGPPAWWRPFHARYMATALTTDAPELTRIRQVAARHGIALVLGFAERAGATLYISQLLTDTDGSVLAVRRKIKPTLVERTVFGEGDGRSLGVYDTGVGRLGALACWEHLQPLTKYALFSQGEQIHAAAWPNFSMRKGGAELNTNVSQVYAMEGQCFVVASTAVASPEYIARYCDTAERAAILRPGGGYSAIFGPDGTRLTDPLDEHTEGLVTATLDLGAIAGAKLSLDPAGHYARPDITRLIVDRRPAAPVTWVDDADDTAAGDAGARGDAGDAPARCAAPCCIDAADARHPHLGSDHI